MLGELPADIQSATDQTEKKQNRFCALVKINSDLRFILMALVRLNLKSVIIKNYFIKQWYGTVLGLNTSLLLPC